MSKLVLCNCGTAIEDHAASCPQWKAPRRVSPRARVNRNRHTKSMITRVLREAAEGGMQAPLHGCYLHEHEVIPGNDNSFVIRVTRNPGEDPIHFRVTVSEMVR